MIKISTEKDVSGLYNNLIFQIPQVKIDLRFDLYYFAISGNQQMDIDNNPLVLLLIYWIKNIQELKEGEPRYLPIDFSDQYTGCLKVQRIEQHKIISEYGCSRIGGCEVYPDNPGNYALEVKDFEKDDEFKSFVAEEDELIESLKNNIKNIKNND